MPISLPGAIQRLSSVFTQEQDSEAVRRKLSSSFVLSKMNRALKKYDSSKGVYPRLSGEPQHIVDLRNFIQRHKENIAEPVSLIEVCLIFSNYDRAHAGKSKEVFEALENLVKHLAEHGKNGHSHRIYISDDIAKILRRLMNNQIMSVQNLQLLDRVYQATLTDFKLLLLIEETIQYFEKLHGTDALTDDVFNKIINHPNLDRLLYALGIIENISLKNNKILLLNILLEHGDEAMVVCNEIMYNMDLGEPSPEVKVQAIKEYINLYIDKYLNEGIKENEVAPVASIILDSSYQVTLQELSTQAVLIDTVVVTEVAELEPLSTTRYTSLIQREIDSLPVASATRLSEINIFSGNQRRAESGAVAAPANEGGREISRPNNG